VSDIDWGTLPTQASRSTTFREYYEGEYRIREQQKDGGVRHGIYQAWVGEQPVMEACYLDGLLNGVCRQWYASGQLRKRVQVEEDVPVGIEEEWYESGQRKRFGRYSNGAKQGPWLFWSESGELSEGDSGYYDLGKKSRQLREQELQDVLKSIEM
jgi:antitoxin component YwqK of YwqJK toxin-antitoxin module